MKPLNRKMFRNPRTTSRATGILASSAPLMTAAQKAMAQGKPLRAQTGASVNTLRSIGSFPSFMAYKQYLDDQAEGARQRKALARDRASSIEAMAKLATADAGMQNIDPAPNYLSDAEIVALEDSRMTNIDAGIKEPFFRMGKVDPSAIFSDGSPLDIFRAMKGSGPRPSGGDARETMRSPDEIRQILFPQYGKQKAIERSAAASDARLMDIARRSDANLERLMGGGDDLVSTSAGLSDEANFDSRLVDQVRTSATQAAASTEKPGAETGTKKGSEKKEESKINKTQAAVMGNVTKPVAPEEATSNEVKELKPAEFPREEKKDGVDPATTEAKKYTASDLLNVEGSMLKGNSDAEKADAADEAAGIKGTLKERVLQRMELQRELFGDKVDIRNDANYAAMMFGLALATGDSGDFKTDLANAGKSLLTMKGKANAEERAEFSRLATSAMNSVLAADEAEAARKATRENLVTKLSSDEKIALMRDGTQREIALAQINSQDKRHAENIESAEYLAQFDASNKFILAAARMDTDTRLATLSAKSALDRAILSSDTQMAIAEFNQESLNNRLDTQLDFELKKSEQDPAEIQRLKFLKDNPDVQTMLIDIAKKSKGDTETFSEELALKIAANPSLMLFQGGAQGLFTTLSALGKDEPVAEPAGAGILPSYEISSLPQAERDRLEGLEDGTPVPTSSGTYIVQGGRLVPQVD